jgi:hypothetical protein
VSAHDRPRHVCAYCERWFDSPAALKEHQKAKRHTVSERQEGGNYERKMRAYDHDRRAQLKAAGRAALEQKGPTDAV